MVCLKEYAADSAALLPAPLLLRGMPRRRSPYYWLQR